MLLCYDGRKTIASSVLLRDILFYFPNEEQANAGMELWDNASFRGTDHLPPPFSRLLLLVIQRFTLN